MKRAFATRWRTSMRVELKNQLMVTASMLDVQSEIWKSKNQPAALHPLPADQNAGSGKYHVFSTSKTVFFTGIDSKVI